MSLFDLMMTLHFFTAARRVPKDDTGNVGLFLAIIVCFGFLPIFFLFWALKAALGD